MNLQGKTVFLTGGGSGIGLATLQKLLEEGAKVASYSLEHSPEMEALRKNPNVLLLEGNILDAQSVATAVINTVQILGSIDILINNAAIAQRKLFQETTRADWDSLIDTNLKGTLTVIQEVLKVMLAQKLGIIVNISSGAGFYGIEGLSLYSLTKAALINFSQSLSQELRENGIEVFTVTPGSTATKMFQKCFPEDTPRHDPKEVAKIIVKSLKKEIVPDENLIVDVFFHTR